MTSIASDPSGVAYSRVEQDSLGSESIPMDAFYGIQTHRAYQNFQITGVALHRFPDFIKSLAMVKQAAVESNYEIGSVGSKERLAIIFACKKIISGKYHDSFIVDMLQGGAGTSTNMNANEVIANIALDYLGEELGSYHILHPNNHVNKGQSTNDVYPTAIRITILRSQRKLFFAMRRLVASLKAKSLEFEKVIKLGRTQLQDAVPMTVGQEFGAWAHSLTKDEKFLLVLSRSLTEVNLGGTAIGTGINCEPEYGVKAVQKLSRISGLNLKQADNLIAASSDMGDFVSYSSALKRLALQLSKICNDLRLLSMGPRGGLGELNLPPRQPGSSIMPGKVNPVIPELVSQVCYTVAGNDMAVSMAAESGQLQLNAMEPLIAYKVFESIDILTNAINTLEERCIRGISVDTQRCREMVESSIGLATALNPYIGYEKACRIAKMALAENRNIVDVVRDVEPKAMAAVLDVLNTSDLCPS